MKNVVFVVWVVSCLLLNSIERYLNYKTNKNYSKNIKEIAVFVEFVIWIAIGFWLYD